MLIAAVCPQCGGKITVDNSSEKGHCPYCGVTFLTKDCSEGNTVNIGSIANSTVIINGSLEDFIIQSGTLITYQGKSTSVTVPDEVTHIGKGAFKENLGLQSLTFAGHVTKICASAFSGCESLTEVHFADGLEIIESMAFYNCKNLSSAIVKDGVKKIDNFAFTNCMALSDFYFPSSLSSIGESAFRSTNLCEVRLSGVNSVGDRAFSDCPCLTEVYLPETLRFMGNDVFLDSPNIFQISVSKRLKHQRWGEFWARKDFSKSFLGANRHKIKKI